MLVLLALASQRAVLADDLDEFGFGARAASMGGAMTSLASDWTATYYNPAGLVNSKHLNTGFGFQYADYDFTFHSQSGGSAVDNQTNRVPPLSAFSLGLSSNIPIDEPDRVGIGIGLFLPTRNIANITAAAPSSQPEWVLFGNSEDRVQILPAVGVKIIDGLYVGAGATIFAVAKGGVNADVGPPLQTQFNLALKPEIGGIFGAYYQPVPWISFGITFRTENDFKLTFNTVPTFLGIQTPILIQALDYYTPNQVSFGTAIDLGDSALIVLDFTYLAYHTYREPFLVATSPSLPVPANEEGNFNDSYIPRIGFELAATDWLFLRAGYFFRVSPVGNQANKTFNLVDCSESVVTLGVGVEYSREVKDATADQAKSEKKDDKSSLGVFEHATIGAELFFQWHYLIGEKVTKTDPNDPIGAYAAGGNIFNMGVALTGRF